MQRKKTVMIVDDSKLSRQLLSNTLDNEYDILEAVDGLEAVACLDQSARNVAAIILDLVMPRLDGYGFLRYLRKSGMLETIPVLMITSESAENAIEMAYDLGAAEVIQKPFNRNIIKKRLRNLIDLYYRKNSLWETVRLQTHSLELQAQKLRDANEQIIDIMSTIIEYRSLESGQHTRRLRGFTKLLLTALPADKFHFTMEEIELISRASAMHDIGKIAIPDSVLLKPGKLTHEEFELMKTHTIKGCEIMHRLRALDDEYYLKYCHEICRWHHERWDGKGYPDGISGDQIPITAQVVALADVYDALTHKRVYKDAYSIPETVTMIFAGECGAFSPMLLDCFQKTLPLFEQLSIAYCDELV